jgi:hypothetical protein
MSVNAGGSRRAVGVSKVCVENAKCLDDNRAPTWLVASPSPVALDMFTGDNEADANDISDAGMVVGMARLEGDEEHECLRRAVFWEDVNASPFDLHSGATPALDSGDDSIALAVNEPDECDHVQVVGYNDVTDDAMLWERDDVGAWTSVVLLDAVGPCGTNGWTELSEATDINDFGQVCGSGARNNEPRAFLLVCRSDFDADGDVDSGDAGLLLAAWGSCPSPGECIWDLDGSGTVDGVDYGWVFADWSGTGVACARAFPCSESMLMAGYTIDDAIADFGFPSRAAYIEWSATASLEQLVAAEATLDALLAGGGES